MKKFLTSEFYFLKQHRVVLRFTVAYFLIAWSVIWFMDFSNETVFGPITRKTGALNVFFLVPTYLRMSVISYSTLITLWHLCSF